ncbi:hypothetical protein VOLCADRAFT_105420 [Volvox carteri f. nagariensis]|uniref:PUB domain-containing protein n=1 Tax=Volvox carteri f. nagariensis TaxID=3068 RepID=D8U0P2_VOLCA|nr:uncharacterized protein VOLCADRAFT_105420 [Volvox carteri f. nagariensis]EFJ46753.1 hypothetical protein VOLCADRAFT_105420 [Volvox carteri f. nagariensis]|eukprot:XP_002952282.1 hypothetical protein VOLCADRAFT_105420 [Volvox carteri f. nagariensis]
MSAFMYGTSQPYRSVRCGDVIIHRHLQLAISYHQREELSWDAYLRYAPKGPLRSCCSSNCCSWKLKTPIQDAPNNLQRLLQSHTFSIKKSSWRASGSAMTEISQGHISPSAAEKHTGSGHDSLIETAKQHIDQQLILEGRRKFSNHLEDHVLDYFHNNPINIEACLTTCIKLFGNVVNNPTEEKYRKVKAASNTLKNTVLVVKGGEDLLLHAGWTPRVIEMEKHWVFDAAADSVRFGVLKEALHLTERALHTVHEKAEKKRKEREEKLHKESAEKERIKLAIEEDKAARRQRAELMALGAAASPPPPSAASTGSAGASPTRRSPAGAAPKPH